MKRITIILLSAITVVSCEFLDPEPIQDLTSEELWSHSTFGEGILTYAYSNITARSYPVGMEYYTDNAVPQIPGANSLALGGWTLEGNPLGNWGTAYNNIKHLNLFLENSRDLIYRVTDDRLDSALKVQRRGEAFFLRAWYQWELLQYYGGQVDGQYMGYPIVTEYLEIDDNLNLSRNTYEECVGQIALDLDSAIARLPLTYNGSLTNTSITNRGRASGLGAMALKARVYLFAASPAYGDGAVEKWERAATAAKVAIDTSGGLTNKLTPYGNFNDINSFDNIWVVANSGISPQQYFPPSLFGNGQANPSQNLVDAFPAADGYPISTSAVYDPADPYSNRDPRFERFIFHNGEIFNGTTIQTYAGGADAPGGLNQWGTRTGYYLQKLMSESIRLTPGDLATDNNMNVLLSRAELYLNFAEAANNAFGPADASLGFSAVDAMRILRMRAGIDSDTTAGYQDQYLDDQAAAGTDAFADFIENERRIELCFEGFRFWDIRRLNQPLDHTVRGVKIVNEGGVFTYNYVEVEQHTFQNYMQYVPLPFSETLIMSALKQNDGW